MHEWALAESILTAAMEAAEKDKFKKITEIKIAIGWMIKKKLAFINKIDGKSYIQITENRKNNINEIDEDEKILHKLHKNPNIEIKYDLIRNLLTRKNVIKQKDNIISNINLT